MYYLHTAWSCTCMYSCSFTTHKDSYEPRSVVDSLLWPLMSQLSYNKLLLDLHTMPLLKKLLCVLVKWEHSHIHDIVLCLPLGTLCLSLGTFSPQCKHSMLTFGLAFTLKEMRTFPYTLVYMTLYCVYLWEHCIIYVYLWEHSHPNVNTVCLSLGMLSPLKKCML